MFGVANQLLATLALSVGTVFILRHSGKPAYGLITFIPALFMSLTTVYAGFSNIFTKLPAPAQRSRATSTPGSPS